MLFLLQKKSIHLSGKKDEVLPMEDPKQDQTFIGSAESKASKVSGREPNQRITSRAEAVPDIDVLTNQIFEKSRFRKIAVLGIRERKNEQI